MYDIVHDVANDSCSWPPPYDENPCLSVANQEFSFTDLLNFGIRGLELDNWYCYDQVKLIFSHLYVFYWKKSKQLQYLQAI